MIQIGALLDLVSAVPIRAAVAYVDRCKFLDSSPVSAARKMR